ncbi:peptide ABC transporter substrate-binding protein [Amycolatopsis jiangsuensis]|uniref:Oligopeptide transport system substrate-binding protein n=1 Tax=Amycolatopsis jiangsuensis TaxID=1181879 RepID=A0A840J7L2_9PSEU|nr:ABC transporter substrate-binding protein [Amycolatopsis jiangsuensis]MBB4689422.1 oligopeptide transport system substrate-binding protein [Amycolatopsis jiangsuensis]
MRSRLLAVLAVAVIALGGCSAQEPARPGALAVGLVEPGTLLPADVDDPAGLLVTGALWTPLADYDPVSGRVTPRAAASITSPDRVTWTVKLRAGGRFHDGSPVTAKSYVDTWRTIAGEHWAATPVLTESLRAKDISAPDDATIRITLDRPANQVPAWLSAPGLAPLPASVLASGDWTGFARHPVGNGPFRLDGDWQPGTGGTLRRVPPSAGHPDEVDLRVGDPVEQYDAVRDGDLDLTTSVPGERHDAMHADFTDRHLMWALPRAGYLVFPASATRFADATVRHSLALGADRGALANGPLAHQADPAKALLPPSSAPGERTGTCRPCTFDPAAAQSLLGQARFTGPVPLYSDLGGDGWTRTLASGLARTLGVPVTAKQRPSAGPVDGPSTVELKLVSPSPADVLGELAELAGYSDAGFTGDLAAAEAAATPQEAGQLYRVAENQALRDLPAIPLWTGHGHAVWGPRVHDVRATPFGGVDLAELTG